MIDSLILGCIWTRFVCRQWFLMKFSQRSFQEPTSVCIIVSLRIPRLCLLDSEAFQGVAGDHSSRLFPDGFFDTSEKLVRFRLQDRYVVLSVSFLPFLGARFSVKTAHTSNEN